jgi:WD40 repeat protein
MSRSIKIWNLSDSLITDAISASYAYTPEVGAEKSFMPVAQQYPLFSTRAVHRDYVDSCRWAGNYIVSKSTKNRVCVWVPDAGRHGVSHQHGFASGSVAYLMLRL